MASRGNRWWKTKYKWVRNKMASTVSWQNAPNRKDHSAFSNTKGPTFMTSPKKYWRIRITEISSLLWQISIF
jgi:hypothetical protein